MSKHPTSGAGRNQPDFRALFFAHFGPVPKRHRYELRFNTSNLHHDLIFLSSLLHDARFSSASARRRGSRVVIDLERDTWEVGTLVHEGTTTLHYLPSRLSIAGVSGEEWRFEKAIPDATTELWIDHLSLNRCNEGGSPFRFVLTGPDWAYRLTLRDEAASVVLRPPPQGFSGHSTARIGWFSQEGVFGDGRERTE
jgi:hypothetical protein